jgi:hypothetical protein
MSSNDDEKSRQEEEARIRSILGPRPTDDPKMKREVDKQRAEAEERRKTGNLGLWLLAATVLTALAAAASYLMGT